MLLRSNSPFLIFLYESLYLPMYHALPRDLAFPSHSFPQSAPAKFILSKGNGAFLFYFTFLTGNHLSM